MLIKEKEIATLRLPFPNKYSGLAVKLYMYICNKSGVNKEMIKCQTLKPYYLLPNNNDPKYYVLELHSNRNTFKNDTVIDCDKFFSISNVTIDRKLVKGWVDGTVMNKIHNVQKNPKFKIVSINVTDLKNLNSFVY